LEDVEEYLQRNALAASYPFLVGFDLRYEKGFFRKGVIGETELGGRTSVSGSVDKFTGASGLSSAVLRRCLAKANIIACRPTPCFLTGKTQGTVLTVQSGCLPVLVFSAHTTNIWFMKTLSGDLEPIQHRFRFYQVALAQDLIGSEEKTSFGQICIIEWKTRNSKVITTFPSPTTYIVTQSGHKRLGSLQCRFWASTTKHLSPRNNQRKTLPLRTALKNVMDFAVKPTLYQVRSVFLLHQEDQMPGRCG